MTKTKSTKRALLLSALSLLICVSMLVGSTFAWFTDSVTSAGNKIQAGTLDVDLYLWNSATDSIEITDESAPIFGGKNSIVAKNDAADTLWEPGKTQVVYLSIKNNGNLDLKYKVALNVVNPDGGKDLYKVMKYDIIEDATYGSVSAWNATDAKSVVLGKNATQADDVELKAEEEHFFALAIHMDESAGNEYQGGEVNFDLIVLATQLASEYDSFDDQYDADAEYPPIAWDGAEHPPIAWDGSVDISWFDAGKTEFTISNGAQLAGMAELGNQLGGKTITLDSDIDLGGKNWTPITIFAPEKSFTFDGGNHTIYNLNITSGSADVGLFHDSVGTIKNLKLSDAQIKSGGRSGILAAKHHGDIINCHVKDSTIEDSYWAVGGIVGQLISGNIKNCSVTNVNVKSNGSTGGIVGALNGTNTNGIYTIENCSVIGGTIENVGSYGPDYPGGGIVGMINTNNTVNITGCSSTATLKGEYIFEICPPA